MYLETTAITDGYWRSQYGILGTQFYRGRMATLSFPFEIKDYPEGTRSFAVYLEDKDAIPLFGLAWIHWVACDLERPFLREGETETATDFVQGATSWCSSFLKEPMDRLECSRYGGMGPKNEPHVYEFFVWALDQKLHLPKGFYYNEMYHAMQGHILDCAALSAVYHHRELH